MKKKNIVTAILLTGSLLVLAFIFSRLVKPVQDTALPYYSYNSDSNSLRQSKTPDLRITSFSFLNQLSQSFTREDIREKIYVADYFFVTCPGICKTMGTQMQRIYKEFENNERILLLSHTSKPEEDSVPVLMSYAQRMGVKNHSKWVFLTGNEKDLYQAAINQYHIANDTDNKNEESFVHTERFVLVDAKGYIRGYYDGTDSLDVTKLIKDIYFLAETD